MKYLKYFESTHRVRVKHTRSRFKKAMNILFSSKSKKDDFEKSIDFILEHCSEWIENPIILKRSINTDEDVIFSTKPVKRYSIDNNNFYNLIMSNDKVWKKYPKRMKSIIGSVMNSPFKDNYYMIPFDGAKFGVAPSKDIFQSFRKGFMKKINYVMDVDSFFIRLYNLFSKNDLPLTDTNFRKFKQELKMIDLEKMYDKVDNFDKTFIDQIVNFTKEPNKFYKEIIECLDPDYNGFKLMNIKEMSKDKSLDMNEIWTEMECVFIPNDLIHEVFYKIDKKKKTNLIKLLKGIRKSTWSF